LEDLNSGVQEVNSLGDLQIASGRVIEGLEIWVGPKYLLDKISITDSERKSASDPDERNEGHAYG